MPSENDGNHLLIITGLSGSGKTTAFKALEDLGFPVFSDLKTSIKALGLAHKYAQLKRGRFL